MNIYLDFDGTMVEHDEYPKIGRFNPKAFQVVKKLQEAGHTVILNTMRAEMNDGTLEKALEYMKDGWMIVGDDDFQLEPIKSTRKKLHPHPWPAMELSEQEDLYIDDIATNIPLMPCAMIRSVMVDWETIEHQLTAAKII